uniref:Uncharacterized protein n=1 Tax=Branchiostoma floridae TaxID=7739 RepID=C3YUA9_BRAFL|eukprot:XP_002600374.1 hypothetical protein BRAFLDRAFT_66608 [Branchiostoma floridae]
MKRLQRQSRVELTVPTLGESMRSKSAEHQPPPQASPHLRHICVQNMKSFSVDACSARVKASQAGLSAIPGSRDSPGSISSSMFPRRRLGTWSAAPVSKPPPYPRRRFSVNDEAYKRHGRYQT